jgi:hypothetical protein
MAGGCNQLKIIFSGGLIVSAALNIAVLLAQCYLNRLLRNTCTCVTLILFCNCAKQSRIFWRDIKSNLQTQNLCISVLVQNLLF